MYPMSQGNPNHFDANVYSTSNVGMGGGGGGMGINPEIVTDAQASSANLSPGGSAVGTPGLGDITSFIDSISSLFNTGPATADTPITTTSPLGPIGALFNGIKAFVEQNPLMALLGAGLLVTLVVNNQSQFSGRGRRS